MKQYADRRNQASASQLNIGDKVIVLRPRTNKLTCLYDPKPYSVTKVKGSMITATRPDHEITRNSAAAAIYDNGSNVIVKTLNNVRTELFVVVVIHKFAQHWHELHITRVHPILFITVLTLVFVA